ncbi:NAD-dependent epimerase/dehydratase family protein [Planosporangium mesophilum]|uniref:NAD-dependent epimerase n=1 Tax=Planosporangium mesophilum TaxID=689768 RepID=A0A8J3X1Q1_9ACTN|nr:NAD-dependent epimerase/dehydratase family protein [Planosporangium mesophilum]NJC81212.1 NAD-dependent epimerase/dehydratase family protein [Planosporangium mesophilum]GII21138.1 NAD-dependent epimerase [Planosporangium mesophilum]
MSLHVVVGAGPVGTGVARILAEQGELVRIVTRRGGGPAHPAIERVAADAADAGRLRELSAGAVALYNCANPPYHRWPTDWPPIANAMLGAAEASGAVLTITGTLYGYGPVNGPMTEETPLAATSRKGRVRIGMWRDALTAHRAGRVRVTEVRGSDYIGAGAASIFSAIILPAMAKGRTARVPADVDAPHSFTYTGDMARMLVTAARDERAWGRAWHAPTSPALSVRDLAQRYFRVAGHPGVKVTALPRAALYLAAPFNPFVRELIEMDYQFRAPFVLDSSAATGTFGLTATPLDETLAEIATAARSRPRS